MSEYIFEVEREYEHRSVATTFADTLEVAKDEAAEIVQIGPDMEWVKERPLVWKLKGYGEHGEACTITKHVLKTGD